MGCDVKGACLCRKSPRSDEFLSAFSAYLRRSGEGSIRTRAWRVMTDHIPHGAGMHVRVFDGSLAGGVTCFAVARVRRKGLGSGRGKRRKAMGRTCREPCPRRQWGHGALALCRVTCTPRQRQWVTCVNMMHIKPLMRLCGYQMWVRGALRRNISAVSIVFALAGPSGDLTAASSPPYTLF